MLFNASKRFPLGVVVLALLFSLTPCSKAQDPEPADPPPEETPIVDEGEAVEAEEVETESATEDEPEFLDPFISGDSFTKAARLDSIYSAWMMPDSMGVRTYWFRKTFVIDEPPSGGHIWLTADDDYNLFINGTYIAAGDRDTIDWMEVDDYDVGSFLVMGENLIAIQASDVDASAQGLMVGLVYETIPDIEVQLDKMVERELEEQERRKAEALARLAGESVDEEMPSEQKLKEIRTIKKNKLY